MPPTRKPTNFGRIVFPHPLTSLQPSPICSNDAVPGSAVFQPCLATLTTGCGMMTRVQNLGELASWSGKMSARRRYPLTAFRVLASAPEPRFDLNSLIPSPLRNRDVRRQCPREGVIRIMGVYGGVTLTSFFWPKICILNS